MNDIKKGIIDQAQEQRVVRDTLILQKVNAAHREAFKTRFPGQVEHLLRLTAERMHKMLLRPCDDLANPAAWSCTAHEIRDMATAIHLLNEVSKQHPVD